MIPVAHGVEIAPIVAPQVLEIVAEGLALREMLLVSTEASVHGVTPHVDDDGVRQHAMDEPDVAEVIRHLVDEMRPSAANRGRFLEVASAECGELLGREAAYRFWVCIALRARGVELTDDGQHVRH